MLERLAGLEIEFADVEARLADPDVFSDQARYAELAKRHKELDAIVSRSRELRARTDDLEAAKQMLSDSSGDDREFARAEVESATNDIERLDDEVLGSDVSPMGGYNEITFLLSGDGVWTRMKHEAGPHRVQRVPVTESQGRIHTSSATVTVLPEAEEVDVAIDERDLQVDVYRSSGPGGQSVNTTDSAVRVTHKPTGLVVAMQDEKSQIQNRAKAMQVLRSRLLKLEQDRQEAEASEARRGQIGGGGRSEKIRTYNFKDNRVTDHRVNLTLYKLERVLAGELDEVSDALVHDEQARRLSESVA
jgi:peptide chain release factor 1